MSGGLRLKRTEPSELVDEFLKVYCDLIASLYDINCDTFLADVKIALKDLRRLKYDINMRHENSFYIDIKYENPAVRCAYIYAYSILNTSIVYSEFSKHLKSNAEVLPTLFSKKILKICCLAGGPATEAVAISKVINDFIAKSVSKDDLFTDVEVTVVDIISEWKTEGEILINALNESATLFNTKKIHFHYSFLKADLLSPFEETLQHKIAEANIVTVVKLASSIEESNATVCMSYLENMIKNVINSMGENSCLFMLDVAGGTIFRHTMNVVSNQQKGALEMSFHKTYRLLPKTLQKMEASINFKNIAKTGTLFPTPLTKVSSGFFIKNQV